MEIQLHAFLTSAIDGSEWSASPAGQEPLYKKLDGPRSQPGRGGKVKNVAVSAGNRIPVIQAVA